MTLAAPHASTEPLSAVQARFVAMLDEMAAINERHGAQVVAPERLDFLREAMQAYEVTVPLIGCFSAGKSSLLNALLGDRLLGTGLTPTTAVPVEIRYAAAPRAVAVGVDGVERQLSVESLSQQELTIETTRLVRLYLANPKLQRHPEVVLVDFPGLDSGLAVHNRAIDEYLPHSVAYLVTVEVETGLTATLAQTLQEIGGHQKPVAVAITKAEKKSAEDLAAVLDHHRLTLKGLLGGSRFELFATSSRNAAQPELEEVLRGLAQQAPALFVSRFAPALKELALLAQSHLLARLRYGELVPEELDRMIREHAQRMDDMVRLVDQEWLALDRQLDQAAGNIVGQVRAALSAEAAGLAALAGDQSAFNARINAVVRQAVTRGLQTEVEPVVKGQLDQLGGRLADQLGSFYAGFGQAEKGPDQASGGQDPFKQVLDMFFKGLPQPGGKNPWVMHGKGGFAPKLPFALPLPFPLGLALPILQTAVGAIFNALFAAPRQDPSEARNRIEQQIQTDIVPQVTARLEGPLRQAIADMKADLRAGVMAKLEDQRAGIAEALEACKREREAKAAEAEARDQALRADLERLGAVLARL